MYNSESRKTVTINFTEDKTQDKEFYLLRDNFPTKFEMRQDPIWYYKQRHFFLEEWTSSYAIKNELQNKSLLSIFSTTRPIYCRISLTRYSFSEQTTFVEENWKNITTKKIVGKENRTTKKKRYSDRDLQVGTIQEK